MSGEIDAFETKRLMLRGVMAADAPAMQRNFDDYDVIRDLGVGIPWPYPEDGAVTFIQTVILPNQGKDHWFWGLFFKTAPDELIGVVDLRRSTPAQDGNRGFWLAKRYWGQGLMTEATDKITDYAFGALGFEQLIFRNAVGNIRSRRIKEKAGATLFKVEPAKFSGPDSTQAEVWLLTKAAWAARYSAADKAPTP